LADHLLRHAAQCGAPEGMGGVPGGMGAAPRGIDNQDRH
jgi:hypothetical protein